ncbi:MAG: hypothetical protein KF693_11165 [Nitrospira sp.]|nr:hypothetical protein [Nitrospira sp.]
MIRTEVGTHSNRRAAALVLVLGIGTMIGLAPGTTRADQQPPMMTVGYQSGTITAVHQTTFEIDGRTFSLVPDAIILDDRGNEIGPGSIVVTAEVKYRVAKERNDKINRMIIFLPR